MTSVDYGGYFKYEDKVLDEGSLKLVQKEIKETAENKRKCLDILKKKLLDEEDLNPCLQEDFLLAFLRVAKYDVNKAFQRIIKFHEERWKLPEIYADYSPSTVRVVENARKLYAGPLRSREDHSAIILLKRSDYDPSIVHYDLIIRFLSMAVDVVARNELNQMCGINILLDLKCSSWSSSWSEYTPSRLKLVASLIQKAVPLRIKGVHIVNSPPIYYLLYGIVYPFLSHKIRNRIILHKDYQSLHSYIDPEVLPTEYDGFLEKSEFIDIFQKVYDSEDFFFKFSKCGFTKKKK